jgi:AcrR family transcriptional regulator
MSESPDEKASGTRKRLLDAAERLFAERGLAGTSVREITEAAGANLASINYHFRSKESLYNEVFMRRVAELREPVLAAAEEATILAGRNPERALLALGLAFLAPHEDRETSQHLLGLFARESIDTCLPPDLLVRELLLPTTDAMTRVIRKIRPSLPLATAKACAGSYFAQLLHIIKGARFGLSPVDEQLEHTVRFTVAAIRHMRPAASPRSRRPKQRKAS